MGRTGGGSTFSRLPRCQGAQGRAHAMAACHAASAGLTRAAAMLPHCLLSFPSPHARPHSRIPPARQRRHWVLDVWSCAITKAQWRQFGHQHWFTPTLAPRAQRDLLRRGQPHPQAVPRCRVDRHRRTAHEQAARGARVAAGQCPPRRVRACGLAHSAVHTACCGSAPQRTRCLALGTLSALWRARQRALVARAPHLLPPLRHACASAGVSAQSVAILPLQ